MGIVGIALAVWTTCSSARDLNNQPLLGTQDEVSRRARSVETGRQQDDRARKVIDPRYPLLLFPEIEADKDALATVLAFIGDRILLHAVSAEWLLRIVIRLR